MMKTHFHFIGIGGSGLSAIARLLLERGYTISGSDRVPSALTQDLSKAGMHVTIGHNPENVLGADFIIRSSAIQDDNPEVLAAQRKEIPVLKRIDFLKQMIGEDICIAIAGTHGKTTTTAMIAWTLTHLQHDPSFIIGGFSKNLSCNAHAGKGQYFVIEADEYDHMFLGLNPDWMILTNIEYDHPDCYPTKSEYQNAFAQFIQQIKPGGHVIACGDDPGVVRIIQSAPQSCKLVTYGFIPTANYWAGNIKINSNGCFDFTTWFQSGGSTAARLISISLQVPGKHNVLNALATLAFVHQMHYPLDEIRDALNNFCGTSRRFEIVGEINGIVLIDDYAHHPTEIRATLQAARSRYPESRIWAVWQPHTYSRIQALSDEFSHAFGDADRVVVTEIFASREKDKDVSSAAMISKIMHPEVQFAPDLKSVSSTLLQHLKPGDVVVVLSAGDANQICSDIFRVLSTKGSDNA